MKKILVSTLLLSILLCGCSQKQSDLMASNPYEIGVNGDVLSYYDDKSHFESCGFEILNNALKSTQSKRNNIFVNKDDHIRNIVVVDEDIITYKGISVGDDVNKILNNFEYENSLGDNYSVLFDGTTEINSKDKSAKQDDFIWINYTTNDKTIEKITICDVLYGKEMR